MSLGLVSYQLLLLLYFSSICDEEFTFLDTSRVWIFDDIYFCFVLNVVRVYLSCTNLDT